MVGGPTLAGTPYTKEKFLADFFKFELEQNSALVYTKISIQEAEILV